METDIHANVTAFYDDLKSDPRHRYRSWEHCFSYFHRNRNNVDEDTACLHLAFYLASWGMYRGSSFLLWKDYLIHKEVVKQILDQKYKHLWDINYENVQKDGPEIQRIFELIQWIRDWYVNNISKVNGDEKKINVSDTLITKILLGTIGCVPAYDRFFISGMRLKGLSFSTLNNKNFWQLIEYYKSNLQEFNHARETVSSASHMDYPIMKIVDMYFWEIGFTNLPKEEIKE